MVSMLFSVYVCLDGADESDMPGDSSRESLLDAEDMQLQANESDESL